MKVMSKMVLELQRNINERAEHYMGRLVQEGEPHGKC